MFNNKKQEDIVQELQNRIKELETQLNEVANDNGSIIIKQLPNGQIELNGIEIDNNSPVEYYNSSKATYGELTMFRIGKESKQREMDKLIQTHMNEIDDYKQQINNLQKNIITLQNKSKIDNDTIQMFEKSEIELENEILDLKDQINLNETESQAHLNEVINRYVGIINGLEEDIKNWKKRYLTINNVKPDGTIITKYGVVNFNNQKGEE